MRATPAVLRKNRRVVLLTIVCNGMEKYSNSGTRTLEYLNKHRCGVMSILEEMYNIFTRQ